MINPDDLKKNAECDLTRPVPCIKFIDNTLAEQVKHISEEVAELWEALAQYHADATVLDRMVFEDAEEKDKTRLRDWGKMAEEAVDIITACRTFLFLLEYTDVEIECVQAQVNLKNRERGYWTIEEKADERER